ncbi:MAG: response regulator [Gammaproteobacteria bacterium]|nr:response regulator [Gammaproteobacteria bacterium]
MRIYIIEHSDIIVWRLVELLQGLECAELVGRAMGREVARRELPNVAPDVLILDMHIVEGRGFEVLDFAQRLAKRPITIALADEPSPEYRAECLRHGADHFFDKTNEFAGVRATLATLLQARCTPPETVQSPAPLRTWQGK